MKLPYGGQEIADLRSIGKAHADMVLVSLIGSLKNESNPVVVAFHADYDWLFLTGLNVMIVCNMETDKAKIIAVRDAIHKVIPDYLGIVWADKCDGLNISWGGYTPKAPEIRRWSKADKREWSGEE